MLDYLLTSIVAFSGLILGIILIYFTKEEQIPGKRYFVLLQNILIIVSFILVLRYFNLNVYLNIILAGAVLLVMLFMNSEYKSYIVYPFLGAAFYVVYSNLTIFLFEASIIYVIGFTAAALLVDFRKKNYLNIILGHSSFLIIAWVLLFLLG